MTRCPSCKSTDVRLHGTLSELTWRPRFFGLFGRMVPRIKTVAAECSCASCLYTFTSRPDGTEPTVSQQAHDALKLAREVKAAVADGASTNEKKPEAPKPMPRPAPDPRVRKR